MERSVHSSQDEPQAIPLVMFDAQARSFRTNPDALAFLREVPAPLSVVAVAGMYRTGKSYLLNRVFLDVKEGFGVGGTVNACTKGLWLWNRPVAARTADGTPCQALVIDSEGIGALDEDSTHDSRVFSLAVLLSSLFIYNSVGSIDEEAIQNLSLVANLTELIQSKSSDGTHFPHFLWVVRDFALQLVTEQGTPLTPTEYLERALLAQKGTSAAAEQKNRVRHSLKEHFRVRECFTMVRPTTDEDKLQALATVDLSALRPEFAEQVVALRSRVLDSARLKTINGATLNGDMLAGLIDIYVDAINQGAAPSIDSAWTYVCKAESVKALKAAELAYCEALTEATKQQWPLAKTRLKQLHKQAVKQSLAVALDHSLGAEQAGTVAKLKARLKEHFEQCRAKNASECLRVASSFLNSEYASIFEKLKHNQYKNFSEYEKELVRFREYCQQHGPPGLEPFLNDFCLKAVGNAADLIYKHLAAAADLKAQVAEDKLLRAETEFQEAKQNFAQEKEQWSQQVSALAFEKEDLKYREEYVRTQLEDLKADRETTEAHMRESLKEVKGAAQKEVDSAQQRVWEHEQKLQETQRTLATVQAQKEQAESLHTQRVQFLEGSLAEATSTIASLRSDSSTLETDHQAALKRLAQRHEESLQQLREKLEIQTEALSALQMSTSEREAAFKLENEQLEQANLLTQQCVEQLKEQLAQAKQKSSARETTWKQELDTVQQLKQEELTRARSRVETSEGRVRELEGELARAAAEASKEHAILIQKLEFLQQEVERSQSLLEQERKHQEFLMTSVGTAAELKREETDLELQRLKSSHEQQLMKAERKYANFKSTHNIEIQRLNDLIEELRSQVRAGETQLAETKETHGNEVCQLHSEAQGLRDKVHTLETELKILVQEGSTNAKAAELETALEQLGASHREEVAELRAHHTAVLEQYKTHFTDEKTRFSERVEEEKDRSERALQALADEYEAKLREEQEKFEEEIGSLQLESKEAKTSYAREMQRLKQQLDLSSQKVQTLEHYLQMNKEQLQQSQQVQAKAMENQIHSFAAERTALLDKIDKANSDLSLKEKELTNFQFKLQQLSLSLQSKEREVAELKETREPDHSQRIHELEARLRKHAGQAAEVEQLQQELARAHAAAEQREVLWDNKFRFLTQQRDQAKQELLETQQKFDATLHRLHKKDDDARLRDSQEKQQLSLHRSLEKVKLLERENQVLSEELELERDSRQRELDQLTQQMSELQEREEFLQHQLDKARQEKRRNPSDAYVQEYLQSKVTDLEQRLKDAERHKGQSALRFEKERARWAVEKERLSSQKNELQELLCRFGPRENLRPRKVDMSSSVLRGSCLGDADEILRNSRGSGDSRYDTEDSSPQLLKPNKYGNVRSVTPMLRDSRTRDFNVRLVR